MKATKDTRFTFEYEFSENEYDSFAPVKEAKCFTCGKVHKPYAGYATSKNGKFFCSDSCLDTYLERV